MPKILLAAAIAALVAAGIVLAPSIPLLAFGGSEPGPKGDRLDRIITPDTATCVERGWPYNGQRCRTVPTRQVRLVSTDRL